jgi:hypothetical protein
MKLLTIIVNYRSAALTKDALTSLLLNPDTIVRERAIEGLD